MSKFCLAEVATLLIGWVSNMLFLLFARGLFNGGQGELLLNDEVVRYALLMALPYVLTFLFCWFSRRFVKAFLLLSLMLTISSTCVYYGFFITHRPLEGGWIFLSVALTQTAIAIAFSLVVFVLGLIFRPKVKSVAVGQASA
jgi:hypothetical protein